MREFVLICKSHHVAPQLSRRRPRRRTGSFCTRQMACGLSWSCGPRQALSVPFRLVLSLFGWPAGQPSALVVLLHGCT